MVLSGCAHAGIINTVTHARTVTGIEKVHAMYGRVPPDGSGL